MNVRFFLVSLCTVVMLIGCATQQHVTSARELIQENAGLVEDTADNVPKKPGPAVKTEKRTAAKPPPNVAANCTVQGSPMMLGELRIGITVHLGYCAPKSAPNGSKFHLLKGEEPMLGNISIENACNVIYCPITPHYDHFGLTDGKDKLQVQVKWAGGKATVY